MPHPGSHRIPFVLTALAILAPGAMATAAPPASATGTASQPSSGQPETPPASPLPPPPASLAAITPPAVPPGARVLRLDDAQQLAAAHSPELAMATSQVDVQERSREAARGAFLPKIDVSASELLYNAPYAIPFPLGMGPPTLFTARDQSTFQFSVQATQPLSGLYEIDELYRAQSASEQASRHNLAGTRSDLRERVTQAYVGWLLALRLADVSGQVVREAQGHLDVATASAKAGVLSQLDVARAEVAVYRARQDQINAVAQVQTARTALALLVGIDADAPIAPDLGPFPDPPPAPSIDLASAERQALAQRPELAALASGKQAADARRKAAWAALLPEIAAVGAYQHQNGIPFGVPFNQAFVGGVLSWTPWDWGQTYYKARAASAAESQLDDRLEQLHDAIYLDVERQYLGVDAAYKGLDVARSALSAASTAERFESDAYAQGAATTTDVLDAATDLARAQVAYAQALYSYYLARAQLEHAIGG